MDIRTSPLLTDLYQLNMLQSYLDHGMTETAVFEFFSRKLPVRRGFLMAAGLAQVVEFLEGLRFGDEELGWVRNTGRFGADFKCDSTKIDQLGKVCRFYGKTANAPHSPPLIAMSYLRACTDSALPGAAGRPANVPKKCHPVPIALP